MLIPLGILAASGAVAAPAYDLLTTTVLGSNAASITLSGLAAYASEYKHLQIRYSANSSGSSTTLNMTMNGISTASYARHRLTGNGSTVSASSATSSNYIQMLGGLSNNSAVHTGGIIDILDAFSTTKNTTIKAFYGNAEGSPTINLVGGLFNNVASLTSITLTQPTQLIRLGSRFSLYGLKG